MKTTRGSAPRPFRARTSPSPRPAPHACGHRGPLAPISALCVPRSTTRPPSSMTMRSARSTAERRCATLAAIALSMPAIRTMPLPGRTMPLARLNTVELPAPEAPAIAIVSPRATENETFSSAQRGATSSGGASPSTSRVSDTPDRNPLPRAASRSRARASGCVPACSPRRWLAGRDGAQGNSGHALPLRAGQSSRLMVAERTRCAEALRYWEGSCSASC